jgi:hypothetical protein
VKLMGVLVQGLKSTNTIDLVGVDDLLDTPTTLRGGVNECGDLFPKTSLLHKNSLVNIQHFLITHFCHL